MLIKFVRNTNIVRMENDKDMADIHSNLDHLISWVHSNKIHCNTSCYTSGNKECRPHLQHERLHNVKQWIYGS